ncbi:MAG: hypothetical protein K6G17_05575 [Oscillospiraceae bacterium]|nr:hypothetical protein [Oscillospiraceae bacterium]
MMNKKKTDLKQRKISLKSKLMSALSLLLVAALMLGTSTYAWFTLSTKPEVSGMSTTVGSNGTLEIALLDNATYTDAGVHSAEGTQRGVTDPAQVTSGVGDSSAVQAVQLANVTWGNIVDLGTGYGFELASAKFYPAAMKAQGDAGNITLNGLSFAKYGYDGRVASLDGETTFGKLNNGNDGFAYAATDDRGVRMIGNASGISAEAQALITAKAAYTSARNTAVTSGNADLRNDIKPLIDIVMKHATSEEGETYDATEIAAINTALDNLAAEAGRIQTALEAAIAAENKSGDGNGDATYENYPTDGPLYAYVEASKALTADVAAVTRLSGDSATWTQVRGVLQHIIDVDNMTIAGETSDNIRAMKQNDTLGSWATTFMTNPVVAINSGLYSDVANFIDTMSISRNDGVNITVSAGGLTLNDFGIAINVNKGAGVTTAYLSAIQTLNNGLEVTGGGAATNLGELYGYVIDLAMRSSAAGDISLVGSAGETRVNSTSEAGVMGHGSGYTVTAAASAADEASMVAAVRLVFVDGTGKVLAVGKLASAAVDGVYPIELYEAVADNGVLTIGGTKTTIVSLEANTPIALSVYFYLDGEGIIDGIGEVTGVLNLQFQSSAELQAMNYSGYVAAQGGTGGDEPGGDEPGGGDEP